MRRALDSEHWISQGRDVLSIRDAVFTVSPISVYLNPCRILEIKSRDLLFVLSSFCKGDRYAINAGGSPSQLQFFLRLDCFLRPDLFWQGLELININKVGSKEIMADLPMLREIVEEEKHPLNMINLKQQALIKTDPV